MIPVEKGKEYTAVIDGVSSDGNGIAHIDGFAVFIPQSVTGDIIKIRIDTIKKRFAIGSVTEIITPSKTRQEAVCPQYTLCGGCQLLHIRYDEQLKIKKNIVENAMRRIGGFHDFTAEEIIGMDNPERYRNKMIFHIEETETGNICGFYQNQSHSVIAHNGCIIGDEINIKITNAVLEYMNENHVSIYNEKTHKGIARCIFTRKSFSTGEIMVVICANSKTLPDSEKLVGKLRAVSGKIASVILNVNTGKNNSLLTDKNKVLFGKDTISDTICSVTFKISPQSFFQVNPVQTEKLYTKALEYADINSDMTVMDIYCGIGTISLCAAKKAKSVIGVEIVERAIKDAKENAALNGISNAFFYAYSSENLVPRLIAQGEQPDIVILDPPRKGSDEKTLDALIKANPQRIVYVSCNPATLARDARYLADRGYSISRASIFDLFPHTSHVETVVLMSRVDK